MFLTHERPISTAPFESPFENLKIKVAPWYRPDQVAIVFSPRFQRTLTNSLSQKDRHLHAAASKVVQEIGRIAQDAEEPAVKVAIAVALQRHGGFDKLTQTSTAADVMKVKSLFF